MANIRPCVAADFSRILEIINGAAGEAYRGVIPATFFHVPYMRGDELLAEIGSGVTFSGFEAGGELAGIMGFQAMEDVDLIRHAYVAPRSQGLGIGSALLRQFQALATRTMLVGTWSAAEWAIRFYEHHGFALVEADRARELLRAYWTVPEGHMAASVVLRYGEADDEM